MLDILRPLVELLFGALEFFHSVSGNWGLAIVLLTVAIRTLLLPLTIKQTRSMRAMQELQPKLTALRERYKDDRERMGQEMMKFYKDNKVNPMAGCLPMIPQIPIMLALYYMLMNPSVNGGVLKGADFLWINDLIAPHDIALVILMGVTQLGSMLMVTKDPQQKKIMIPFVLILPIITWSLPAGVVLYWVTMNIWVIGQQWIQFRMPSPVAAAAGGDSSKLDEKSESTYVRNPQATNKKNGGKKPGSKKKR